MSTLEGELRQGDRLQRIKVNVKRKDWPRGVGSFNGRKDPSGCGDQGMAPGEVGVDLRIEKILTGGERTVRTFIFGGNTESQGEGVGKNENTVGSSQQPTLAEMIIVIIATSIAEH